MSASNLERLLEDVKAITSHPLFFAVAVTGIHVTGFIVIIRWLFGSRRIVPKGVEPERRPILEVIEETRDQPTSITTALNFPQPPPFLARTLVKLAYSRFGALFLAPRFLRLSGTYKFQGQFIPESPTFFPLIPPKNTDSEEDEGTRKTLIEGICLRRMEEQKDGHFRFCSIAQYHEAYSQGRLSPVDVAKAALSAIAHSDRLSPPLRAFTQLSERNVMDSARASALRWKEGKPLSFMDGVPVAIKEEYKWEPYVYRCGTMFEPSGAENVPNSALGMKLQKQGAVVLGVTNMTEFGTSPVGTNYNALHQTPVNPYNTDCYTGGSSCGSASSVATGICALTLGSDGGGSVRIPSALCGIVGIKPTFGRLVDPGIKSAASTVGHCGLHGGSVADVLLGYNVLAGKNEAVPISLVQPPVSLKGVNSSDLEGIRIGFDEDYIMVADSEVSQPCLQLLTKDLKEQFAEVKKIKIAELEMTRLAHLVTIGTEMACGLSAEVHKHIHELNTDTLLPVASALHVPGVSFINAQKQRTRSITVLKKIFEEVDCIITPTTPTPAPRIPPHDHKYGCTDTDVVIKSMTYAFIGNLTGVPCITVPVGYSEDGLPIGIQIMGRWWEENVIFRVAMAIERIVESKGILQKPKIFYDLMKKN
jgi:Asp-tRNA(Asn)/Glu-tRNA(Gln) amidotransferase A subunit family amidase